MLAVLPWLVGFQPIATTDHPDRAVIARLAEWHAADEDCVSTAYGGLALEAGNRTVLASFSQGIVVLDDDRQVIAEAPGFECTGSQDELVGIAAGDAWIGTPVIALAATTGGRNESLTWLTLYRVGDHGQLLPVFTGEVEHHVGHATRTGTVTVIPGGLIYVDPEGGASLWFYDRHDGRYRSLDHRDHEHPDDQPEQRSPAVTSTAVA